jgi:hypothetical protein
VDAFLREANRQIIDSHENYPTFVPSDYNPVYHALKAIAHDQLAPGVRFCEWGSGFGVVTCLAALVGFQAVGIEIEPRLVVAARQLAADFDISADFLCDSFLPSGCDEYCDYGELSPYLVAQPGDLDAHSGYYPDDFDLIFAYPGPDNDEMIEALFRHYAGSGAVLLTNHGREGLRLRRKAHAARPMRP